MILFLRHASLAAALATVALPSVAAPVIVSSFSPTPVGSVTPAVAAARAGFEAALPAAAGWTASTNGLETTTLGAVSSLAFGPISAPLTTAPSSPPVFVHDTVIANSFFNTTSGGKNYLLVPGSGDPNVSPVESLTIGFGSFPGGGVNAFGFYATGLNLFDVQVELTSVAGQVTAYQLGNPAGGNPGSLLFWGFHDAATAYSSFRFINNNGTASDYFALDDLIVARYAPTGGGNVPLPGTLALALLGLAAGLGIPRRA